MYEKSAAAVASLYSSPLAEQSQAPSSAPDQAAQTVQPTTATQIVQLGGEATGAGTLSADSGENPAGRPCQVPQGTRLFAYAGGAIRNGRTLATSTCIRRGRQTPAVRGPRSGPRRLCVSREARKSSPPAASQ